MANYGYSPEVQKWLANDTTYKATTDAIEKARKDYIAEKNRQQGVYNTEYQTNLGNLNTSRTAASGDMENDYAARGMLRSGVYANDLSQLSADYNTRQASLDRGKANFNADLEAAYQDFLAEQELAKQNAMQSAIQRRAMGYGF